MAQYQIAAWGRPKVPGDYTFEMDSLQGVDAEFVEVTAESDDEFLDGARDADAIVARGQSVSEKVINGLKQCRIIALDGVGTNHVAVSAATAKGIPITNCPDINIQEVAEHTATLILAAHRRLLSYGQDSPGGVLVGGTSTNASVASAARADSWVCLLWQHSQGRCAIDEAVRPAPPRPRSIRHGDHSNPVRRGTGLD